MGKMNKEFLLLVIDEEKKDYIYTDKFITTSLKKAQIEFYKRNDLKLKTYIIAKIVRWIN
jgi:hypothetical protein